MHYLLHNAEIAIEASIINLVSSDCNTALHLVISKSENGGSTLLHAALKRRSYREVETLIHSFDVSELPIQDDDGNTTLHLASYFCMKDAVAELCNLMTDPEDFSIRNDQGQTAYDVARSKRFVGIAECINEMLNNLLLFKEENEEEIWLKNFRFLHRLFNTELDDRFFNKDYKPSQPLQIPSQQRNNESTQKLHLDSMHEIPQISASSGSINKETNKMTHDSNNMQDTTTNQVALQPQAKRSASCTCI